MRTLLGAAVAALFLLAACEKDPFDPATHIPKLDDPRTFDQGVKDLERLRDLRAIKPLGKAWRKWNKPSSALRAIITIAGTDDPDKKRTPNYDDALEFLIDAVDNYDPGFERSIDDATVACDALGKSQKPEAVDVLIRAATKTLSKQSPANRVRVAAIKALGRFKNNQRVVDTLIRILDTDPDTQLWQLNAAAALAIAETGTMDPKALDALAKAAFADARFYPMVRAGIIRMGKQAIPKALAIYQEKDPAIVEYAKEKKFAETAPGALGFKGALLLGDLRAVEHLGELTAGLKRDSKPIGIDPSSGAESPASTHTGILDALRHIGDPAAAPAVYEYMMGDKVDPFAKPMAIDVYSMLATDTKALDWLLSNVKDEKADLQLRLASAIAYGRLARTSAQQKILTDLATKYEADAKKYEEQMKSAKGADARWEAEQYKIIAEQMAGTCRESAARIEAIVKCDEQASDRSPDAVATCLAGHLSAPDVSMGKPGLPRAERALIELGKMGKKAQAAVPVLLEHVDSSERIVREGILLALPRMVDLPCKPCTERLKQVIKDQEKQTTLDLLNAETRVVMYWFSWAGS